jgi:hypothetical protein
MNRTLSVDSKDKPAVSHVEDTNTLQKEEGSYDYLLSTDKVRFMLKLFD